MRNLLALLLIATTATAQTPCPHRLVGTDSFGDGWNGASVDVFVNGTPVVTGFEVSSLFAAQEFSAASSDSITTVFHSGSFDAEVQYEIIGGACLRLAQDGPSPSPGLSLIANCVNPGSDCPPPPPANDDCDEATAVSVGSIPFTTLGASTDGVPLIPSVCDLGPFGDEQIHDDVWFCFTPTAAGPWRITTTNSAGFDTRIAVYEGCGSGAPAQAVACNDNELFRVQPPFEAGLSTLLTPGTSYKIRVGATQGTPGSSGTLRIEESLPPGPGIDICNGDGGNQAGCTNCPCANNIAPGSIGGCINSSGNGARLYSFQSASVVVGSLVIRISGAVPGSFAVLTSGDELAPTNAANPCFGFESGAQALAFDGLRCAVVNTRRHGGRAVDSFGNVGFANAGWGPPNAPAIGIAAAAGFVSGDTRHFQAIYRELPAAVCGRGLNTTQALSVTFTF